MKNKTWDVSTIFRHREKFDVAFMNSNKFRNTKKQWLFGNLINTVSLYTRLMGRFNIEHKKGFVYRIGTRNNRQCLCILKILVLCARYLNHTFTHRQALLYRK